MTPPLCNKCGLEKTPSPYGGLRFICTPCRRETSREQWRAKHPPPTVQAPAQPLSWRHLLGLPYVFSQQQAEQHYRARASQCEGAELGRLNEAYMAAKLDLDKRTVGWAA